MMCFNDYHFKTVNAIPQEKSFPLGIFYFISRLSGTIKSELTTQCYALKRAV